MADNYLEFCEVLDDLTDKEVEWLKSQLTVVYVFGDHEFVEDDIPAGHDPADADFVGCRAYRDMEMYDPDLGEPPGFSYEFVPANEAGGGQRLLFYADGHDCLDRLAHLVQKFLHQFSPGKYWSLTYSITCSKPRVGEFGGGGLFVTARDIQWFDVYELVEQSRMEFIGELAEGAV